MQAESSLHRSFSEWFFPYLQDSQPQCIEQDPHIDSFYPTITDYPLSAPEPIPMPKKSHSTNDDLTLSPAAMFLTGFSAAPTDAVVSAPPDGEGQVISGYTLGPIIGYGGFSTIRKGISASGSVVAVKIVTLANVDKENQRLLEQEHAIWASLCHEHILPLYSASQTSHSYFFFTQYCPAGSLFDILKRDGDPALPQDDAGMMFRQVVRGLRYLHEVAGLVHRDIKLENVLVDGMGVCRITDFGMAKKLNSDESEGEDTAGEEKQVLKSVHLSLIRHNKKKLPRHRVSTPADLTASAIPVFQPGSLPYAAPELLSPRGCNLDPAQDIWALGVLLYALLTGTFPFMDAFEPRLQMKILRGVYEPPVNVGRGAERVLEGCLRKSIDDRWSIAMVDEVAWGIGWGDIHHDEEALTPSNPRSRSRHAPRDSDWCLPPIDERESVERPSTHTARRRSSSRAERSRSRAPSSSRHSRSSSSHLSISGIPDSIKRALSNSTASSPQRSTPSSSRERGRRPNKFYDDLFVRTSRNMSPITPTDSESRHSSTFSSRYDMTNQSNERGRRTVRLTDELKRATEESIFDTAFVWPSPVETRSRSRGGLLDFTGLGKLLSWMRGDTKEESPSISRRSGSVPPNSLRLSLSSSAGPRSRSVVGLR